MDYAIYKINDGKHPRVIHRFTQEVCNHNAKNEARKNSMKCGDTFFSVHSSTRTPKAQRMNFPTIT